MTDSMVERVARAVFVAADDAHNTWPTPQHPECVKIARAAIAAMREPTEAQMRAGTKTSCDLDYLPDTGNPWFEIECKYGLYAPEVMVAWRAMIDTALEHRGEEG